MFTSYFDSSHSGQGKGVWVVSGWLATVERWERFAVDWKLVLAKYNVPYFHMKEFAHSRGAFANGWKGENNKRELFIRALLDVVGSHAQAGFACMVDSSSFDEVDREYCVRETFGNEYAVCARTCVAEVNNWILGNNYRHAPEYVFEDGDERGRLSYLMESQGYPSPIFKPSRDKATQTGIAITGLTPLQAADFAAYEMRKAWDDFGDNEEPWRYRKSFAAIGSVVQSGSWKKFSADDLRETCKRLNVLKRG